MTDKLDKNRQDIVFFGAWEFNFALNLLESSDQSIRLEPKTADLLKLFLAHTGQVLSRDELLSHLWPDVIVSDDSLTQVVIKLRKALGDNTRKPKYIQTIPKRGYQFLASTKQASDSKKIQISFWFKRRWFFALVLSALFVGALYWFMGNVKVTQDKAGSTKAANTLQPSERPSVMLMPLATVPQGEMHLLLADQLSNAIVSKLSKQEQLWVIRPPVSMDGSEAVNLGDIPSASYLVTGGVQQNDTLINIDIELIDTATSRLLWSEHYEQSLSVDNAVLKLGDRISTALEKQVLAVSNRIERQVYTQDAKAYALFMQGQNHLLTRRKDENVLARTLYQEALERDPMFARAYAGMALSHAADYRNQWSDDLSYSLKRARELAKTALGIQSDIPHLYWVLAYVSAQNKQHDVATDYLNRALALNPNYADAYALLGGIKTYIGQPEQTITLIRKAMRLNPNAGALYFLLLGRAYFFIGDDEQAIINLKESLSRNPSILEAHVYMAAALVQAGDIEEAKWAAEEIEALKADFSTQSWLQTYPMSDSTLKNTLAAQLKRLNL